MKIDTIEAADGEKTFGRMKTGETHGRFPVEVPLHLVEGAENGPTLVVQAGVSGLEIEPAAVLPKVVDEIDPADVSGTLVLVPLMNTSGFEFEQVNAAWDDKNLNELGRGDPDGTVSEQMVHQYFRDVLDPADAVVDVHTGALWSYNRYAGVFDVGDVEASRDLAVAIGLPQVLVGHPDDGSMAFEAASDGTAVVSAQIGGGPGLYDHRQGDMERVRNAVLNSMKHLDMIDGDTEPDEDSVSVLETHTVLEPVGERGMVFIDKEKRGTHVSDGEQIGYVRHPFNGEILEEIEAPRDGVMLRGGVSWPVQPEGVTLAILGDEVETVPVGGGS
jgi:hypothetical protein